jgi:predicted nuclease of predicted toxin-antitoxin system
MMPERAQIRFLLDEHYPGWLAEGLAADGVEAVALTAQRPGLRGVDDQRVLEVAVTERRVVVTEDVSTFSAAAVLVPDHPGIVYCHHARFPRTRPGLERLRKALVALGADPPAGLGEYPVVWWLAE